MRRGFGSCGPPSFPFSQILGYQLLSPAVYEILAEYIMGYRDKRGVADK
jgi:hypothetical protein